MTTESCSLFYITAPDNATARKLAEHLLTLRLIACANILGGIESLYRWQGSLENDKEAGLLVKSQSSHKDKICDEILSIHPYECPCIVELPIAGGHQPFLEWIVEQTSG